MRSITTFVMVAVFVTIPAMTAGAQGITGTTSGKNIGSALAQAIAESKPAQPKAATEVETKPADKAAKAEEPKAKAEATKSDDKKKSDKETPEETIARLSVPTDGETEIETRIRLRALELLMQDERAKAESAKRKARKLSPAEVKATEEVRRDLRHEEEKERANAEARIATGLSCPNPEDEAAVFISGAVSKRYLASTHTSMMVINETDAPMRIVRIAGSGGPIVVDNLCPRGVITLQERLGSLEAQTTVAYAAVNATDGQSVYTSMSQALTMRKCTSIGCKWEFAGVWKIRLQ